VKSTPFLTLLLLAAPVAAQDVTPAIDPGMAGIAAANREALEQEAARSGDPVTRAGRRGYRARRMTARQAERRAVRRAARRERLRKGY
jgi:hypothetical protein